MSWFYSALSKDRILSSNSWPLRFFPITRPSLFRRYDCGIALMLYLLATGSFQKLRFETWVHGKLSSITACSHCSLVLSSETPIISKPASLYFLCNLTRFRTRRIQIKIGFLCYFSWWIWRRYKRWRTKRNSFFGQIKNTSEWWNNF